MASINNVARHILGCFDFQMLTTMKLQKLTFYSQAYALATTGRPLFHDDFYAWRAGPVASELFKLHRGKFFISMDEIPDSGEALCDEEKELVQKVCDNLGKCTGKELSERIHAESPWAEARGDLDPSERSSQIISKAEIARYYSTHPVISV